MTRDSYWDSLKFVLVFLVVLAHCIASYRPSDGINQSLFNFLCSFLMPTFVFVSGMFSHMKDKDKYKTGIFRIFEVFVVIQIIEVGMKIIPGLIHDTVTPKSIIAAILCPQFGSWYLLCLTYWRVIVFYIPERILHHNPAIVVSVCFFISLLGGFIPVGNMLALQRTMCFLPFFFMGYYAKNIEVKKYVAKISPLLAIGVLLSACLIYYHYINYDISFILYGWSSYWFDAGFSPLELFLARGIFLISAIITGLMVMRLVPTKVTLFSQWGIITLFIYAYHLFMVNVLRHYVIKQVFFPRNEWILFVVAIFITVGLIILSRVKLLNFILNPISNIIRQRKHEGVDSISHE